MVNLRCKPNMLWAQFNKPKVSLYYLHSLKLTLAVRKLVIDSNPGPPSREAGGAGSF